MPACRKSRSPISSRRRRSFRVATVQNSYNLADRDSDDVVDYCQANGIGFIPYYPLGGDGELTRPGGALDKLAKAKGATPGQVALAWLLKRSPVMLPIPGTSKVAHLEENVQRRRPDPDGCRIRLAGPQTPLSYAAPKCVKRGEGDEAQDLCCWPAWSCLRRRRPPPSPS